MTTMLGHLNTNFHKNNLNNHLLRRRTPPSLPLTDSADYTYDNPNYGGDDDYDNVIINPSSPSPDSGPPEKKSRKCGPLPLPLTPKLCTHCGVHETPQWRVGPNGPSTLCNACGLSYLRMGYLLPEYRPIRSPSFSFQLHSHFYTRKKMMIMMSGQPDSEMSPHPVSSVENLALAHPVTSDRYSDPPISSSGNLDHPVSSSEKCKISAFTTKHPSSGGSTNDAEANEQQKSWYIKQDNDALYFKVDMPGVRKRDVKIYVKGSTLKVKGVRKLDPHFREEEKWLNTYVAKVALLERDEYNVDGIKVGLKHGVLKVIVPKVSRDMFCTQTS